MGIARSACRTAALAVYASLAFGQTSATGSIQGDVLDASTGRGIAGARVRIQSAQDDPLVATTDEHGHFRFEGLAIRSYEIIARFPGFAPKEPAANRVSLAGNWQAQISLEMRRYGVISGKVTDAFGVPLEGVMVQALQRFESDGRPGVRYQGDTSRYGLVGMMYTNDLGEYRIAPLAPGSYYVLAQPGSSYFALQPDVRPPSDPKARPTFSPHALKPAETKPVEVAEGNEARADIQMIRQSGARVSGRISGGYSGDGLRLTASVWSSSPNGLGGLVSPTVVGDRFEAADLLPGQYFIEAAQFAKDDPSAQYPLTAARRTVQVGAEDVSGVDLTLAPTPSLDGAVVFERGCASVPVWIQLQSGGPPTNLHVGVEGTFELQHLRLGEYKLYARGESPPGAFAASATLAGKEILKDGFEVTAETRGPLRIMMSCPGR